MDWFTFIWQTLGAGAVAAALILLIGKLWADHWLEGRKAQLSQETERLKAELGIETETHKWKLKKKETVYQREILAGEEFFVLRDRFSPKRDFPDKDWADVQKEIISRFTDIEHRLRAFRTKHGPFLSTALMKLLDECIDVAGDHQFAEYTGDLKAAEDAVEKVLNLMEKIERQFVKELRA